MIDLGCIIDDKRREPSRGKRWWVLAFDEFKEYRYKVPLSEMDDITTDDGKPLSYRIIIGLTYIDGHVLRGIRRKAQGFSERHIRYI